MIPKTLGILDQDGGLRLFSARKFAQQKWMARPFVDLSAAEKNKQANEQTKQPLRRELGR